MVINNNQGLTLRHLTYVVLLVILLFFAYLKSNSPLSVEVHKVAQGNIESEVFGTGTLEAKTKASLGSQIPGRIEKIFFDEGDFVKEGQLLVLLENSELQHQVKATEATLEAASAAVERVKAELLKAEAVEKSAKSNYKRDVSLRASKVVAVAEADKSEEQLSVAKAEVKRLVSAIAEAEAHQRAVEGNLAYHKSRLSYSRIQAPFDGLVVTRLRDRGDIVVPGSTILEVVSLDTIWVSAWVDEIALQSIAVGQFARVCLRSHPDVIFPGIVDRIGRQVDRETREFVVDVKVNKLPENWAIGQRAEVFIKVASRRKVLTIPQKSMSRREGKTGAWSIEDGRLKFIPLKLGLLGKSQVEVLDGLKDGMKVVVPKNESRQALVEGRRVVER